MTPPFAHLRVLEVATDIAGPYTGKLFADAGADVVKVEPADGDPLRRTTACGATLRGDAALFQYLNASKRSVQCDDAELLRLAAAADVVVVDRGVDAALLDRIRSAAPAAAVVSVTPFGRNGPWADAPATEFTLQAACGSTGGRGLPEGRPLAAGGRLGEWIGGAYAAVAGAAYARRARTSGVGAFVDLSLFEAMLITMGGLSVVSAQITGPVAASAMPPRHLELPSIVPTADGYVGFCTITGQQFQDFLVLIERFDWLDDQELHTLPGRVRRRDEFNAAVLEWTSKRTTAEVIEAASAMRIPVAPIGSPETVTQLEQFVERGVFERNPAGFVQPRPPYRIEGATFPERTAAPALGEHSGTVEWAPRQLPAGQQVGAPLADVRVLDLTAFWAGPSATFVLAALGADVIKLEGVKRPDGMRFAGGKPPTEDSWWETGSIFLAVNADKRGLTLELGSRRGQELARQLVAEVDVVIENFSPRVMANLGLPNDAVAAANPAALLVRMPAFGLDGPWRDRVGFAQTMEQVSGMAWLTGERDGPPVIPRGACDPIAGLHAAFAVLASLEQRERTGRGGLVEVTMVEAALNCAAQMVIEHSAYGAQLTRDGNRGPVATPQGVYRCAGEEQWVALAVATDAQWRSLCQVLGEGLAADPALTTQAGRRAAADRLDQVIEAWTSQQSAPSVAEALRNAGIPAAEVTLARDLLSNPQLQARGFFEQIPHPVVGTLAMPSMPLQLGDPSAGGWLTRAAPTMGEHNREVLHDVLGLADADIAELAADGVIATRPAGL
jgi:crotonobetainyl-CoA:carnitine CoA-transferase CaiB-like acyl-CoA transferase